VRTDAQFADSDIIATAKIATEAINLSFSMREGTSGTQHEFAARVCTPCVPLRCAEDHGGGTARLRPRSRVKSSNSLSEWAKSSGEGAWESNPPERLVTPHISFEDCAGHRARSAPIEDFNYIIAQSPES
jgi:hypothetical protein